MNKSYRLVVFDWEGTLGDTLGQIFNHVATEARRLNFGEIDQLMARQSVDLGLVKALRKVFPHLTDEQHEDLLSAVQSSMSSRNADVYLMPGAKEFITRLCQAGIDVAIASNKNQQSLQRSLILSGLDRLVNVTRSVSEAAPKPCPDMLQDILDVFGASIDEALMIGDSLVDLQMAESLGVDFIGVDFYHQQKTMLLGAGAMAVFDNYQDLADYLQLPTEGGSSHDLDQST